MKSNFHRILSSTARTLGRALPRRWAAALERDPILILVVPMLIAALLMRLNNAVRYPSVRGFDSYAHATYIWHVLLTWTVPFASDGWGRFHPPLYYALSAGIWSMLRWLEPSSVLKILNVIFSVIGMGSAVVAWDVTRRYLDAGRAFAWTAALFVMFLPVHIYTAPMLGNEGLSTAFCSLALFFLVRLLQTERVIFAVILGIVLGLAMLTKFTAIVVVGSSLVAIGLWGIATRRFLHATVSLALVSGFVLLISGWFYARNVEMYGNPFQMSRDFFATKRIESTIPAGNRDLSSYTSFDTTIFRHPTYAGGPVLDSVWAGVYATAWFDAHGGWFLPSALFDVTMHHVGRILMFMGLVPTFVLMLGMFTGIWRLLNQRLRDPILLPMVITTACMIAMFIIYTFENRIFTAVKASYLLPAIVPLAFWFALGLRKLADWSSLVLTGTSLALVAMAGFILPVFTYQLFFNVPLGSYYWNSVAVLDYIAGFPESARVKFAAATVFDGIDSGSNLYLAHENLGNLALDDNDPYRALAEVRRARSLVTAQVFGLTQDVKQFTRNIDAEYWNLLSVIYHRLGWSDLALESAIHSVKLDPLLPEAHFDEGLLLLERGHREAAMVSFERAVMLDPGFIDAQKAFAGAEAQSGLCDKALARMKRIEDGLPRRVYPQAVGTGELHDAAIARRRHIELAEPLRTELSSDMTRCTSPAATAARG